MLSVSGVYRRCSEAILDHPSAAEVTASIGVTSSLRNASDDRTLYELWRHVVPERLWHPKRLPGEQ